MINSFKCKESEKIFNEEVSRKFPADIQIRALTRLRMINAANALIDLKSPPSNHLEPLQGDRKGQYSIRINGKYRICFVWQDSDALELEIVDYH